MRTVTAAAATYRGVAPFKARIGKSNNRRAVCGGAAVALGSASAVAMMAGTATVAAAWMVAGSLSRNPELRASAPFPLEITSMPKPQMRLADAADMFGSALASSNPAYVTDTTQEAKSAATAAPIFGAADVTQSLPKQAVAMTASVPLPRSRPLQIAQIEAKPNIARAASVAAVPSPGIAAPAPSGEAVYSLASADTMPTPPATTGSLGAATNPAAVLSPVPPAKPAAPALAYANPDVPVRENHTAIYDIVAHTVYMPDGERLEAHSGLGRFLDDPHYAAQRARGPTPPNTYDLTLRGGLFHGVQAIRLNPVSDSKMFGRDGILAHTYMLGPSGQSFGCVSFRHYDAFLRAFERGEVNRMVVVPHLQEPPPGARADAERGGRYASNGENDY